MDVRVASSCRTSVTSRSLRDPAPSASGCASIDGEIGLAALYQKYAPAIYAHCRRMLQSQAAARDATQEAFVRVLARGPRFPNDDDGRRYLYRASTNVCLNQIRERKVHTRAVASLRVRPSSSRSMEGRQVDREFVAAVLDRCGEANATVAVMYYVDGMSQIEIAETLGITRRTVFSRLRKLARIGRDLLGLARPEGERRGASKPHDGLHSAFGVRSPAI
ncbi:MAG: sigma-70 family RNA polymerase sigma factor [Polyangia bacterium]|jgi:RNA polymerase sigma-70 factor (ECF subfamily)